MIELDSYEAHRRPLRRIARLLGALALAAGVIVAPVSLAPAANAAAPPTPVTTPFDAPLCENTVGDPSVDADGGPVSNLLSVFGQRLADYNAGKPVILYNNVGRSGWTSTDSQYTANPLCATRYVEEVGGPVSSWIYCTYDRASSCGWTNANGELERAHEVLPGLEYQTPDTRLSVNQQKLQSYIIQNDLSIAVGPDGSGGTVPYPTVANNDSQMSRMLRQNLVHCIDNPGRSLALEFCANNMSGATQARIIELIGATPSIMLAAASPASSVIPGAQGQVVIRTTLAAIPLELTVTGGSVSVCDGPATLSGTTLLVAADASLPAEVTLCVTRADEGNISVAVAGNPPVIENLGFVQSKRNDTDTLCQIFSLIESERQTTLTANAAVVFADAPAAQPSIGTSLVDVTDGDRILPAAGGTVVDTIAYENLIPGTEYTVSGELMRKSDGSGTGITGSTTFIPTEASGTVDVTFTVPSGFAGHSLVAFEQLYIGATVSGTPIATHEDLNDAAQTVTVEASVVEQPGDSKTGQLASTGASLPWIGAGAAGLMLVAGATLLAARRARTQE